MRFRESTSKWRKCWRRLVLLAALFMAGCVISTEYVQGPQLVPAPLPSYQPGDNFRFDNGAEETVVAVDRQTGNVAWRRNRNRTMVRSRSFIFPDLEWKTAAASGGFETTAPVDGLWPLKRGQAQDIDGTSFEFRNATERNIQSDVRLSCWVAGTVRLTVPAGTFDTVKVTCRRFINQGRRFTSQINWFYAPDLGHYVQRETKSTLGGENSRVRLLSYSKG